MPSRRSSALGPGASLLAQPGCAACDEPVPFAVVFCPACASAVQRVPVLQGGAKATFDAAALGAAPFVYGGSIARAIVRMKYEGRPDLARPLGDLLWRWIEPHRATLAEVVVVPVPLHPVRLAERGFNQAAMLAACVASRLGAPMAAMALARTRDTPRQTTLDRRRRAQNVAGAFVVRRFQPIANRPILLVDDVRTTGATLDACAEALRASGAVRVRTIALAQADAE